MKTSLFLRAHYDLLGWYYHPSRWVLRHWGNWSITETQREFWKSMVVDLGDPDFSLVPQELLARIQLNRPVKTKIVLDQNGMLVYRIEENETATN